MARNSEVASSSHLTVVPTSGITRIRELIEEPVTRVLFSSNSICSISQCDGKLWSIVIRIGEVVEKAISYRAEPASKGRICRGSEDFS